MSSQAAASDPLGLPGFTFADLHDPGRLADLYRAFTADVAATEPELWRQWEQYREVPESLGAVARGNLIVQMAPHVSRFVTRLFGVGSEAEQLGRRRAPTTTCSASRSTSCGAGRCRC